MPNNPNRQRTVVALFFMASVPLSAAGCQLLQHPTETISPPPSQVQSWDQAAALPGRLGHQEIVSGRWSVPLSGLLNLEHPKAIAEGMEDKDFPIAIPVHVITHPKHGVFLIDTGVPRELAVEGMIAEAYLAEVKVDRGVEDIIATAEKESGKKLAGLFLTHLHLDHVLGLGGIPKDVPIYAGPNETTPESLENVLTRETYQALFAGRPPIREWAFEKVEKMAPTNAAIDVFGDGSFWAVSSPGHTTGSTAYVAFTTSGPKLFTGDTSHTRWGWDHGVEPGTYTADGDENAASLEKLKLLADQLGAEVFVGHEVQASKKSPTSK